MRHLRPEKKVQRYPSEQLDLVETINDVDKIKKKRSSIIIFLALTVGISLCFWLYRQFQNTDFKQIKLPEISIKLPSSLQPKFSPEIPENWSVFVQTIGTTDFSYSSNLAQKDFVTIKTPHDPSYAKKYLPDGVSVLEKTNSTSDYLEILSQISTPQLKFEIYSKIPGKINPDSTEIDTYSKLVALFYWHLLK